MALKQSDYRSPTCQSPLFSMGRYSHLCWWHTDVSAEKEAFLRSLFDDIGQWFADLLDDQSAEFGQRKCCHHAACF